MAIDFLGSNGTNGRWLAGLLFYGIFYLNDSVVIFAHAFTWIPYIRNIVIHHRNKGAQRHGADCGMDASR